MEFEISDDPQDPRNEFDGEMLRIRLRKEPLELPRTRGLIEAIN